MNKYELMFIIDPTLEDAKKEAYIEEVKSIIFKYVFTYYNPIRIHTSNPKGLPPAEYRRQFESVQCTA